MAKWDSYTAVDMAGGDYLLIQDISDTTQDPDGSTKRARPGLQSDFAAGTKSSGTYTPDPVDGNFQVATNGGAHTLAPPTKSCCIVLHYTNNGSAGAITTSGFTLVEGDALTTTDTHEFVLVITKINDVSVLTVKALQ